MICPSHVRTAALGAATVFGLFATHRYAEADIHRLRFIHQARKLGFSIKAIGELLGLWANRRRASSTVKAMTRKHIAELDAKIAEMQMMKHTLEHLAQRCHGDERPECPILDGLAA